MAKGSKPSRRATARAVAESSPPLTRTTARERSLLPSPFFRAILTSDSDVVYSPDSSAQTHPYPVLSRAEDIRYQKISQPYCETPPTVEKISHPCASQWSLA